MKRMLLLGCALIASGVVHAQEDGPGNLIERIESKARKAQQAMGGQNSGDPALTSSLVSKSFNTGGFKTKEFTTADFRGTKSAKTKTFTTRSFLGIKNPWFGKKVFDTDSAKFKRTTARESGETYSTGSYAVRNFSEAGKSDAGVASEILPRNSAPRKYLGPEQPEKAIDQFTQNLHRDLTMEEVQVLLNKGQKAR
jgi:hypothetical protein